MDQRKGPEGQRCQPAGKLLAQLESSKLAFDREWPLFATCVALTSFCFVRKDGFVDKLRGFLSQNKLKILGLINLPDVLFADSSLSCKRGKQSQQYVSRSPVGTCGSCVSYKLSSSLQWMWRSKSCLPSMLELVCRQGLSNKEARLRAGKLNSAESLFSFRPAFCNSLTHPSVASW